MTHETTQCRIAPLNFTEMSTAQHCLPVRASCALMSLPGTEMFRLVIQVPLELKGVG